MPDATSEATTNRQVKRLMTYINTVNTRHIIDAWGMHGIRHAA